MGNTISADMDYSVAVRWVIFGTYDKSRHPRVAVLVDGLRASGDTVTEINEPLRVDTAARVAMLRQPWRLPGVAARLLGSWAALVRARLRYRRRADGVRPDAVLVGYLGHFDVRLARRLFPGTPIVLDHLVSAAETARDRNLAGRGGVKDRLLHRIDAGALRSADLVVVDTAEHHAALPAAVAGRAVVAPVGATEPWFRQDRPPGLDGGPLRVIFVGVFTPLHGAPTIAAALAALADDEIDVTMVGTGQDLARSRELAAGSRRVRWLDWVDGAELPALVASHHVNLGIFGTSGKARAVVPTKVYQGAAAGCAIVTSDTVPQRSALGDAAVYVPAGDPAALAAALRALAANRPEVARLGAAARRVATARYTPAAVVAELRERAAGSTIAGARACRAPIGAGDGRGSESAAARRCRYAGGPCARPARTSAPRWHRCRVTRPHRWPRGPGCAGPRSGRWSRGCGRPRFSNSAAAWARSGSGSPGWRRTSRPNRTPGPSRSPNLASRRRVAR